MKKYLTYARYFVIAGLCGGVFYREFSKIFGVADQKLILAGVHVHFLVLGVFGMLILGLVNDKIKPTAKKADTGLTCYVIGTAGTGLSLWIRGIIEVLVLSKGLEVGKGLNGAVSGIAGIFHIILGCGFIMLVTAWKKECQD